jgi:hypothetical protein
MSAIQAGGEGIKMMVIDTPDTMIIIEEMIVVTAIAIIEPLATNGTEKIKMTITGIVGAEVETT